VTGYGTSDERPQPRLHGVDARQFWPHLAAPRAGVADLGDRPTSRRCRFP